MRNMDGTRSRNLCQAHQPAVNRDPVKQVNPGNQGLAPRESVLRDNGSLLLLSLVLPQ